MMTEKFFTAADLDEFQLASRKFKKVMTIAIMLLSIVVAAIWSLVIWAKGSDMMPFLIVAFILFAAFEIWIYRKLLRSIKQDLNEQVKLTGEVNVLEKKSVKNNLSLKFDDEEVKEIGIVKKLYDKINTGDRLYLEISKHHKHLFKITRQGEDLK